MQATLTRPAPLSNREPIDFETDIAQLPLQGHMPAELRGTLVRNGPNPLLPDAKAHLFVGDGMLHAFHIADGQVCYRNRWVRTSRLQYAQRTGHNLISGNFGGSLREPGLQDEGAANTHVVWHAGRMLALEEAHLPIAVDPHTLQTLGVAAFGGALGQRFTAHPKTDPRTGEMVFFAYGTPQPLSRGMAYGVLSPEGKVTRFEHFDAPYASMVHDFAITARHVVFPVAPLTASRERAMAGRPPYAWEPEYGTRVGILPRQGSMADMQWWSGPPCYVFHVMNAWETSDHLFMDVMQFDQPPLFPRPDGSPAGSPHAPARLVRWSFALNGPGRSFSQTVLEEIPGEFPRIDERHTGLAYRHGWFAGHVPGAGGAPRVFSRIVHVDHAAPHADVYTFNAPDHVSEPVFVPRHADAAEGDGWILATAWRGATNTSDLVVFDARHVAAGPVCTAALPHRVPDGFHGSWFDDTLCATGARP